jgi:hypothetical protein
VAVKGWDPACEDLAEHFLDDPRRRMTPSSGYALERLDEMRRELAQRIQDAVEDWFAEHDDEGDT